MKRTYGNFSSKNYFNQALDCFHIMNPLDRGRHPPSHLVARTNLSVVEQIDKSPSMLTMGQTIMYLALQELFKGDEEVVIGNGTCLPISHIGSYVLYKSNFSFKLNHILNCLTVAANLLPIQQLCG